VATFSHTLNSALLGIEVQSYAAEIKLTLVLQCNFFHARFPARIMWNQFSCNLAIVFVGSQPVLTHEDVTAEGKQNTYFSNKWKLPIHYISEI
jgi:hypothetical protein